MVDFVFSFPAELRAAQRELHQVRADLRSLLQELPWSVEAHDGYTRPEGHWYPVQHPPTSGWTEEQQQAVTALRERERDLAADIVCHPHRAAYASMGRTVAARSALKHIDDEDSAASSEERADSGHGFSTAA
ncbi:hypothetical protein LKL35_34765 [Streptomyces sp. ET3-23]|uniref:hypothetical protein n=1 Tax=Streptomyces sp. ET3-23 TaxID=2885643 RepID=UPI001D113F7C|nr:hypothetical protein [Streptomyces sp. ET3-23]MCC2280529.1 hypothetical protein [Streptomyces sp. ET3-23]